MQNQIQEEQIQNLKKNQKQSLNKEKMQNQIPNQKQKHVQKKNQAQDAQYFDVVIIGAGASGLMCAIEAGKRKRKVLILDHASCVAKKVLISGGGLCNFSNYKINYENYISHNSHFCKSALSRYTAKDFIELLKKYKISFSEKKHSQLFCDNGSNSKDIVNMLVFESEKYNVKIKLHAIIESVGSIKSIKSIKNIESVNSFEYAENDKNIKDYESLQNVEDIDGFQNIKIEKYPKTEENFEIKLNNPYKISTNTENFICKSLVIATGGLSIPKMGATPFGHKIAKQFGIKVWTPRPGLVPIIFNEKDTKRFSNLAGVSFNSIVKLKYSKIEFKENCLFTHKGLSGPAILQISSYWKVNDPIIINTLPNHNLYYILNEAKNNKEKKQLKTLLSNYLPKRMLDKFISLETLQKKCLELSVKEIEKISKTLHAWEVIPKDIEGYNIAEITVGGVDCNAVSSKTMESNQHQGLFFIGEVLDVTGWLGGYNLQWAWSSGYCAGLEV